MQWPSKVASRGPGVDPGEFSWRSRWLTLCKSRGPPWRPIFKFPLLLVPTVERQKSPLPPRRPRSAMAALRRFRDVASNVSNAEGFRTPAPCTTVGRAAGGRRSKASQGGNRGEEGRCLVKRGLWGFLGRRQIACVGAQPDGAGQRRRRASSVGSMCGFGVDVAVEADLRT